MRFAVFFYAHIRCQFKFQWTRLYRAIWVIQLLCSLFRLLPLSFSMSFLFLFHSHQVLSHSLIVSETVSLHRINKFCMLSTRNKIKPITNNWCTGKNTGWENEKKNVNDEKSCHSLERMRKDTGVSRFVMLSWKKAYAKRTPNLFYFRPGRAQRQIKQKINQSSRNYVTFTTLFVWWYLYESRTNRVNTTKCIQIHTFVNKLTKAMCNRRVYRRRNFQLKCSLHSPAFV